MTEHGGMHERVEAALGAMAVDVTDRIRMVAALGAVTGFDDWAPRLLIDTPGDTIRVGLKATVADILHTAPVAKVPKARTTKARTTPKRPRATSR